MKVLNDNFIIFFKFLFPLFSIDSLRLCLDTNINQKLLLTRQKLTIIMMLMEMIIIKIMTTEMTKKYE